MTDWARSWAGAPRACAWRSRATSASLPLGAVYFLDRAEGHRELRFEPTADPYLLLASTFNFVIRTPERLAAQLDTCAAIARSAALFRVAAPRSMSAAEVGAAVADHARGAVGDQQAGR